VSRACAPIGGRDRSAFHRLSFINSASDHLAQYDR